MNTLGLSFNEAEKNKILSAFMPLYAKIYADHVTLIYKSVLMEEQKHRIGKSYDYYVTSHCWNNNIQAVTVKLMGVTSHNSIPHITISAKKDIQPNQSNVMLHNPLHKTIITPPMKLTGFVREV